MFHALDVASNGTLLSLFKTSGHVRAAQFDHILVAALYVYASEADQDKNSNMEFLEVTQRVLVRGIYIERFDQM